MHQESPNKLIIEVQIYKRNDGSTQRLSHRLVVVDRVRVLHEFSDNLALFILHNEDFFRLGHPWYDTTTDLERKSTNKMKN